MHVLIVTDQHPDSLGGAQVAIRAQRAALERSGHRVTIVAPELHRAGYTVAAEDRDAYVGLPSVPLTKDRDYGMSLPGRRVRRALAAALDGRPPVDIVHVQGDFWGALIGVRAARDLDVPLVFTMHNNVDRGTRAVTPLAPLAFLALRCWRSLVLGKPRGEVPARARGAWRYLAALVAEADAVISPSRHFASQLETNGVAREVEVVRGGIDDELIAGPRSANRTPRARPRLVWIGRMSHEKRPIEFVDALAAANCDADVRMIGSGILLSHLSERVERLGLSDRVSVLGAVPYAQALAEMRQADALVQTSVGFETQGLTPFEAAALGTPTIFCDARIAEDAAVAPHWLASDEGVGALAEVLSLGVGELATQLRAHSDSLRVHPEQTSGFLQSEQTRRLVKIYERVLRATDR